MKWSWRGTKSTANGIIGKEITPLHTSRGVLIVEHANNGDGSLTMTRREVAFHCDIETGKVIDKLKNPYTGATNDVEHLKSGPVTTVHTAHSMAQNGQELPIEHKVGPARVVGDDVFINHDLSAKFPGPNGRLLVFYDYVKYHARLSHLANPEMVNVPAAYAIQDYIDWRAWQEMADRDGLMPAAVSDRRSPDSTTCPTTCPTTPSPPLRSGNLSSSPIGSPGKAIRRFSRARHVDLN